METRRTCTSSGNLSRSFIASFHRVDEARCAVAAKAWMRTRDRLVLHSRRVFRQTTNCSLVCVPSIF
mgnify:CR=1 FL=1